MTVDSLIKKLQKLPPRTRVFVDGYEDNYDEVIGFRRAMFLKKKFSPPGYSGLFYEAVNGEGRIRGIYLASTRNFR